MQRKNNLLKSQRGGFAIIMAIAALVVLTTIMAFSIQMTSKTAKRVVDVYVKNQAELYAKNAAEFALFQIANSPTRCNPTSIGPFILDTIYSITVNISYAYSNEGSCTNNYIDLQDAPDSQREYGYAKIDVVVDVNSSSINSEPIRIFRRYIEDITPYLQ